MTATKPVTGIARHAAFDRLRGVIMILMAIDHASFFIARVHAAEFWATPPPYYGSAGAFVTRWVTHLCAPGFFVHMGAGMAWFAASRLDRGWTASRIRRFFLTRGAVLLLVQQFIEDPAWRVLASGSIAVRAGSDRDRRHRLCSKTRT